MATNFQFLKKVNKNLFEIISDAEKLYRDEYFEQCMAQTRRFGEQICKDMLSENNKQTGSFDEMLATLKDHSNGNAQEKEFIDDLYFLKKNGNQSVQSGTVKKDAMTALECLKRSFEIAINYSVYNQGANANILKLDYDVELLITDKKSKKSLKERYEEEKAKQTVKKETEERQQKQLKQTKPQKSKIEKKEKNIIKIPFFWKIIIFLSSISIIGIVSLAIAIALTN